MEPRLIRSKLQEISPWFRLNPGLKEYFGIKAFNNCYKWERLMINETLPDPGITALRSRILG